MRHCGLTVLDGDQVLSVAFGLDPGEAFVSTNWPEYFGGRLNNQAMDQVRADVSKKRTIGFHSKFAILNVGDVRQVPAGVQHHPITTDPSYAGIHCQGDPYDMADELALRVKGVVPGRSDTEVLP